MPRKNLVSDPELDSLLASALKLSLRNRRGKGIVKDERSVAEAIRSIYADPANWAPAGIVSILYTDESTGATETIGLFQDLRGPHGARKLLRVASDSVDALLATVREEISHDSLLVHPPVRIPECPRQTALEAAAVRQYLSVRPQRIAQMLLDATDADDIKMPKRVGSKGQPVSPTVTALQLAALLQELE